MNKNEAPWASRIEKGLTTSEAQKRLREFGFNRIPEKEKDTDWK